MNSKLQKNNNCIKYTYNFKYTYNYLKEDKYLQQNAHWYAHKFYFTQAACPCRGDFTRKAKC